jgi:hypothetical protein
MSSKSLRPVVILIVGVEASGKSRLSHALCGHLGPCRAFSDYRQFTYKGIADAIDFAAFRETIGLGQNVVLNDVSWVYPDHLRRAREELRDIAPGYGVITVYFENDPRRCLINSKLRNQNLGHDRSYIESRTREYSIPDPLPDDSLVVPVWSPECGERILNEVLATALSVTRR